MFRLPGRKTRFACCREEIAFQRLTLDDSLVHPDSFLNEIGHHRGAFLGRRRNRQPWHSVRGSRFTRYRPALLQRLFGGLRRFGLNAQVRGAFGQEARHRSFADHLPVMNDGHPVAGLLDLVQEMAGKENRFALFLRQMADETAHLLDPSRVETVGWLIQQE